jgi:hypothetical protein
MLMMAACAKPTSPLAPDSAARPAYAGPLYLPFSTDDQAPLLDRAGAAGKALGCRYPPYGGGTEPYDDGLLEVWPTYAGALVGFLGPDDTGGFPRSGYRLERTDGNWALLSWDVDGRTKIAIIMRDGIRDYMGQRGWGVETWAECDPAEFPAAITDALGIGVWSDRNGERVPVARVQSFPKEEDLCDYSGVKSLQLGQSARPLEYVRDARGELTKYLLVPYDGAATLPADPTDSGWHRDGRELWLSPRGEIRLPHGASQPVRRRTLASVEPPLRVRLTAEPARVDPLGRADPSVGHGDRQH